MFLFYHRLSVSTETAGSKWYFAEALHPMEGVQCQEGRQGFLTSENDSRTSLEGAWNSVIYYEDGVIYFVIYDAK